MVGLLAGDDGIEWSVWLIPPELHELGPLEYGNKITEALLF